MPERRNDFLDYSISYGTLATSFEVRAQLFFTIIRMEA